MRFTGTMTAKLDAKGRVFLPASFRKLLRDGETEFVLRRDAFQACLTVYPRAAWDAEVADLRSRLDAWNGDHRMLFRRYVADVEVFSLDASGRFLIPKRYLRLAGIAENAPFPERPGIAHFSARLFAQDVGEVEFDDPLALRIKTVKIDLRLGAEFAG